MIKAKNKAILSLRGILWGGTLLLLLLALTLSAFESYYKDKIYPTVTVAGLAVGGKTQTEVESYWLSQNEPFQGKRFEFRFDGQVATVSAQELDLGYDATLSATQAYLVGRSKHAFSNFYTKFLKKSTDITPYFRWNTNVLDETIDSLAQYIDIPVADALFQFNAGRVTAFRPSHEGKKVNAEETKKRFEQALISIPSMQGSIVTIPLPVDVIQPSLTTDRVNAFGIKELIGRGYSEFAGSISGRIHNVALAASRINGLLIKPGTTFSFNDAVGDISAATGYQSAYIIKEGRTVLGDGGGVCQVSTTLFRAALNAGLSIVERRAHAYRVHFYEDGGFKAGLDATVFSPSVDLKIKNDTPGYILIQTKTDTKNMTLTFELYGTNDGRQAEILNHQVWGAIPPPPPLYQEDPTLPKGVTKQVDWAAWGAQASFRYKVTRTGEVLQDEIFSSRFQPWQAVYLQGTL